MVASRDDVFPLLTRPRDWAVDFPAFYEGNGVQWDAGDMFVLGPYRGLEKFTELSWL